MNRNRLRVWQNRGCLYILYKAHPVSQTTSTHLVTAPGCREYITPVVFRIHCLPVVSRIKIQDTGGDSTRSWVLLPRCVWQTSSAPYMAESVHYTQPRYPSRPRTRPRRFGDRAITNPPPPPLSNTGFRIRCLYMFAEQHITKL